MTLDAGNAEADAAAAPAMRAARAAADAAWAAALFAIDPIGTGGIVVRSAAGPARDAWVEQLTVRLQRAGTCRGVRRVPCNIGDGRLLGGLDLAATLQAGRPVAESGVLARSDGGVVLLAMAERLPAGTAARIAAVLDRGEVAVDRDGFSLRAPARFGVVALDEGIGDDERLPEALGDRLAFRVDLEPCGVDDVRDAFEQLDVEAAIDAPPQPAQVSAVELPEAFVEALSEAALALAIASLRAPLLALRVARASAAQAGRRRAETADAARAARLVLGPRARALPASPAEAGRDDDAPPPPPPEASPPQPAPPAQDSAPQEPPPSPPAQEPPPLLDVLLAAAAAVLPSHLLAALSRGATARARAAASGRTGVQQRSGARGRPIGSRHGEPRGQLRLAVVDTLRAAAPWQRLRQRARSDSRAPGHARRIEVRRGDFRVAVYKKRSQTTVIFVVDASGSSALHRLAEAKGAVELFLADCYVRRDQVALVAFRGSAAEILLAPTRSLARAKRCLAALPGGGGTPIAAGLLAAHGVAGAALRRGEIPLLVVLTDGKANVGLDGSPGRERAMADAQAVARQLRAASIRSLLIDSSPRAQPAARTLAEALGAEYVALPHADARVIAGSIGGKVGGRGGSEAGGHADGAGRG